MCQNGKKNEPHAVAVKKSLFKPGYPTNRNYSTATCEEQTGSTTTVMDEHPRPPGYQPLAITLLKRAIDFALNVTFGHVLAFVVELFAKAQAQQQLNATISIKVELERHQCIAAVA